MEDTGQDPAGNVPETSPAAEVEVEDDEEEDAGGFSFPAPPLATDAYIVPVYPIFGRPLSPPSSTAPGEAGGHEPETATVRVPLGRLLLEEREFRARQQRDARSESARAWRDQDDDGDGDDEEEASAAADEELEGVPPESYCLWAPGGGQASAPASPRRCRKSGSTGSVLRWRRISDRLVGRSHSDGKEKFVFLTAAAVGAEPPPRPPFGNKVEEKTGGGGSDKVRDGGGAAHQLRYYGRGGGGSGSRRRSYLPYKQELVGLFANVSGLRRSYHPF